MSSSIDVHRMPAIMPRVRRQRQLVVPGMIGGDQQWRL
jgi:hypothetical protein